MLDEVVKLRLLERKDPTIIITVINKDSTLLFQNFISN